MLKSKGITYYILHALQFVLRYIVYTLTFIEVCNSQRMQCVPFTTNLRLTVSSDKVAHTVANKLCQGCPSFSKLFVSSLSRSCFTNLHKMYTVVHGDCVYSKYIGLPNIAKVIYQITLNHLWNQRQWHSFEFILI